MLRSAARLDRQDRERRELAVRTGRRACRSTTAGTASACVATRPARSSSEHVHCRNCPVYSAPPRSCSTRAARGLPRALDASISPAASGASQRERDARSLIFRIGNGVARAADRRRSTESPSLRAIHSLPHRRNGVVLGLVNIRGELLVCVSLRAHARTSSRQRRPTAKQRRVTAPAAGHAARRQPAPVCPVDEVHGTHRFTTRELRAAAGDRRRSGGHATRRAMLRWQGTHGRAARRASCCSTPSTGAWHEQQRSERALDARPVPPRGGRPGPGADARACSRSSAIPGAPSQLEACMRAAHSLKGAARIVGLGVGVSVAHAMEDCFVAAQRGTLAAAPGADRRAAAGRRSAHAHREDARGAARRLGRRRGARDRCLPGVADGGRRARLSCGGVRPQSCRQHARRPPRRLHARRRQQSRAGRAAGDAAPPAPPPDEHDERGERVLRVTAEQPQPPARPGRRIAGRVALAQAVRASPCCG